MVRAAGELRDRYSYYALTSSMRYQGRHTLTNGIYLLSNLILEATSSSCLVVIVMLLKGFSRLLAKQLPWSIAR